MDPALRLLLRLRLRAWFRRIGRNMQTVKGAILTVFFGMLMFCWLFGVVAGAASPGKSADRPDPEVIHRIGPPALLAMCLLLVLTNAGQHSMAFTQPEVNLLFPGPFSRRQLLAYKLATGFLMQIPSALFMAVVGKRAAGSFAGAFVAIWAAFMFMYFFGVAAHLLVSIVGAVAYNRFRKVLFVSVLAAAAAFALPLLAGGDAMERLEWLERQPVVQVLLAPLGWIARAFTAPFGVELLKWGGLALLLDGALLVLIFALDAQYLESAAAASEKLYERIQRMRAGPAVAMAPVGGRPSVTLPMMPYLGGAGPIAWRQMLVALRGLKGFAVLALLMVGGAIVPAVVTSRNASAREAIGPAAAGIVVMLTFVLSQMAAFDFRADIDRMDVLKSLPIPGWRLAL